MAGIRYEHATLQYPGAERPSVNALDLDIADGEFLVLVGPSGSGKSTALRMLAGLEEISDGEIRIGDRVVNDLPPKNRDIAMVFQNYALYPHMTVRENLEFGLRVRKTPEAETKRLVENAAQILEISNLLDRKPKQLSGGQRQRVALGRAIVRQPSVFLFDEPLSNLDAKLRVQMRAEIKQLQQRLKTTTVYVTHDQIEAMTMGQRIAVMKDGKIQQVGTPLEIYGHPETLFVANFIGTPPMNFLPATVADGGTKLAGKGFSLPVPQALRGATAGKDGSKIVVGVRPEHVLDPSETARGETARLKGKVEVVEPLGDKVIIHVRVGDDVLVYQVEPHAMPEMGDDAELVLELEKLHLFDAATERRLAA